MNASTKRTLVVTAIGSGVAAVIAAYVKYFRPRHLRWGSTPEEAGRAMPMDDVVTDPTYITTRSITIEAPPDRVWPWLAQMGESPRGGFYSYAWIERALGMKVENADRVLPEFQELSVGQALDRKGGLVVRGLERDRWLVLGPREGVLEGGDVSWCIALEPLPNGTTRVISRCRARLPRTAQGLLWLALLDPGQLVMERKWLLGLKERAELLSQAA